MKQEFPSRKETRLREYDYSQPGYYFVTVCTAERGKNVLCSIHNGENDAAVSGGNVGAAALGGPQITLTAEGEIVTGYIQNIDQTYRGQITVDDYVVMPDHIHLIIQIHAPEDGSPRAATPTALSRVVSTLKGLSSKKIGRSIWQRGYYEHIVRNDADLTETRRYIENNPMKWGLDKN